MNEYIDFPKSLTERYCMAKSRFRVDRKPNGVCFTREVFLNGEWDESLDGMNFRVDNELKDLIIGALSK